MSGLQDRLRAAEGKTDPTTEKVRQLLRRAGQGDIADPFDQAQVIAKLILEGLERRTK